MSFGSRGSRARRANPTGGRVRSLLLRAWLEPNTRPPLRVRVLEIDPDHHERPVVVTVSIDEVCQTVRQWLETVERGEAGR